MKKILVTHDQTDIEFVFEVDEDKFKETAKLVNEFFSGHKNRALLNDGCHIKPAIALIASEVLFVSTSNNYNFYGVLSHFEEGVSEGYPPLDGSWGIKLLSFQNLDFDTESFIVQETY